MPPLPSSSSSARPKRAAEEFARSNHHDSSSTTKKPRFDHRNPSTLAADDTTPREEDFILDADVIGKSGKLTKRNAVNIDGYESDSENEGFKGRGKMRGKKEREEVDEDEDMFADFHEEEEEVDEDMKRKDVKFLDHKRIEGQVMDSRSGGRVSGSILLGGKGKREGEEEELEDESSSGDEEVRDQLPSEFEAEDARELGAGSKKTHAPRLDAFNLKAEEEEGRYDESGNFVRKAVDPEAGNDNWLEGVSRKDMKRAKEAAERREVERRRKDREDDAVLTCDLLDTLISRLETGETPLEALQRLNKGKQMQAEKRVPKWKLKKLQKDKMDVDGDDAETAKGNGHGHADPKEEARRKAVDAITGAADALYSRGQHEIYEAERELLMRQYKRETGEEWKSHGSSGQEEEGGESQSAFFYRWSDSRDGGEAHGPYDGPTMKAWNDAGYFGEGVEFQRVGHDEWSRLLDFVTG
ncbi:uncharacterized protein MYCFIDRAFT_211468 [Pseudocercospora fijiensis CIRAD86]|uniref:GYF domain-containing protein n=1 Tax=Pseudocercospora fijiensis (strain CIRAD86) TaxID=383855 RepID=M3AWJ5_PSEFD|nr:uncharacterized protein MYCFIDRAFT_211468 [Pseudocercospora fijiensis CIRAD86]EME81827.1 hypothetical protein MYCFIDRAFT_211468 [Pseudocercospora fijiensis CIRAD86]